MKFKDFWKNYRREVAKLLTTHFALAVFGILCASPFLIIENSRTKAFAGFAVSIFTFAFYYYLVRTQIRRVGEVAKPSPGKKYASALPGLYMGILASLPSFLCNFLYFLAYMYQDYADFKTLHAVMALIEAVWDAEALGLRIATGSPFSYLAASVLPMLFTWLAFYLGTRGISLFGKPNRDKSE